MHTWNILAYFFVHLIFAVPTSDMQTGLIDTPMQFPLPHIHRPSLCMRSWWKGSWGQRRRKRGGEGEVVTVGGNTAHGGVGGGEEGVAEGGAGDERPCNNQPHHDDDGN